MDDLTTLRNRMQDIHNKYIEWKEAALREIVFKETGINPKTKEDVKDFEIVFRQGEEILFYKGSIYGYFKIAVDIRYTKVSFNFIKL